MLHIRFGTTEDTIVAVESTFDFGYEEEWLEDELVKEMILDVDKSQVISPHCIESPVLGQIAPSELSGGVKALILMLKTDEEIWATACGDNCAKWITKIAEIKDLTISLEHYMRFEPDNHFSFIDADTGKLCTDYFDEIIEHHL